MLEAAAAEINERAGAESGADWLAGDVRDREEAERMVRAVLDRHGRLDVLVNNAGGQFFSPAELIAAKGWRAVWRLNVEGGLNTAEAAFELAFSQAGAGTVVNVTLSPHNGMPGMAHSGSARATVETLTRELARRWQPAGVTVTAVAAGHFDTEVLAKYPASVRAGASRTVPLQRLGTVAEHAWLIALLASRWALRSAARRSRSTAHATTGAARGHRPAWRTSRARCRARRVGRMERGLRAKCCGCTEAFQASRAGSIPVARLNATGSGAVW